MNELSKIIEGCKAGKNRYQRKLYNRFAVPMYRLCFRYLKNELDTEDVLSTGFTKAFDSMHRHNFKSDKHFENWLRRVMINESLMLLRSQLRFRSLELEEQDFPAQSPEILHQLDAEEVYALIQALPNGYRTIFNLYVLDGYSHSEIAQELDISESTSRSQLAKARKMLQNQLITLELP